MGIEYEDYYIAYLDIMGFKELVKSEKCINVYNILSNEINPFDDTNSSIKFSDVKLHIMSDSVVMYIKASEDGAFIKLISCCSKFIERFMFHNDPILFRGGITKGKLFVENNIIFGEGLIRAYLLENKSAKYPRVILSKELFESGKNNDLSTNNMDYKKTYSIPLVYEDLDGWLSVENWFLSFNAYNKPQLANHDAYKKMYEYILKYVDSEVENSIKEKYVYLKNHYDDYMKK